MNTVNSHIIASRYLKYAQGFLGSLITLFLFRFFSSVFSLSQHVVILAHYLTPIILIVIAVFFMVHKTTREYAVGMLIMATILLLPEILVISRRV